MLYHVQKSNGLEVAIRFIYFYLSDARIKLYLIFEISVSPTKILRIILQKT